MKKIALLLAAALMLSACNNNKPNPYIPKEVSYIYTLEGFNIEIVRTTWKEEDDMACLEANILSQDSSDVIAEYDLIIPWLSNVKEVHLEEHQYLNAYCIDEVYRDGALIIAELQTVSAYGPGKHSYEYELFLCNGREIKDVTPLDSEGNHPFTSYNTWEPYDSEDAVPTFGYKDINGDMVYYALDFENLRMLPVPKPQNIYGE